MHILKTRDMVPTEAASLAAMLATGKKVGGGALGLLKQDHRQVEGWFKAFHQLVSPERKADLAQRICLALKVHTQVEEELFYPAARAEIADASLVDHAKEEHEEADQLIAELEQMQSSAPQMDQTMQKLQTAVEQHVREEEEKLFPQVAESPIDLSRLGGRMAALRVALFCELTGRSAPQADRHPPQDWKEPAMTVSKDTARAAFVNGLRDAHAMERQSEAMLSRQAERLENYPAVEERVQRHLEETREQLSRLDRILDGMGEDRSTLKDAAMNMSGAMSAMVAGAADDEIIKNALSNFAFEKFEEASYESLITMGQFAGETGAIRLLQSSLSEERAMGNWIAGAAKQVTTQFLELRSQGAQASR